MSLAWVGDNERTSGRGRAEGEQVFWERVASGRRLSSVGTKLRKLSNHSRSRMVSKPLETHGRAKGLRTPKVQAKRESRTEGPWESARLAAVTMLTVVVFGLGWASFELEDAASGTGTISANGYDWSHQDFERTPTRFLGANLSLEPQSAFE